MHHKVCLNGNKPTPTITTTQKLKCITHKTKLQFTPNILIPLAKHKITFSPFVMQFQIFNFF